MAAVKNVTVIPARKRVGNTATADNKPKLKVAAYCRVSTDSEEQATSYDAQVEHYTEFIRKNPEWEFAGIYADDGISGTNTKKAAVVTRDAEQEMLRKRIDEMRQFLQTQTNRVTEYDEQMVRRLIEKITVFDDKLIFKFKSGMTLELKR